MQELPLSKEILAIALRREAQRTVDDLNKKGERVSFTMNKYLSALFHALNVLEGTQPQEEPEESF